MERTPFNWTESGQRPQYALEAAGYAAELDYARRRCDFCDFWAQTQPPFVTVNFCEVSRAFDRLELEQLMKLSAPSPPGLFVAIAIAACNHSPRISEVLAHSKKGQLTP